MLRLFLMSRKDDRDMERPHYYSQFWINQAREAAGQPISFSNGDSTLAPVLERDEDDDEGMLTLPVQKAPPTLESALEDFDDLPLPPTPAKPIKQKSSSTQRPASLSSFADLAALSFGADADTDELAVGADDDADDIMSRIESEFEMSKDVEPDEEEAASLESLSEEEDGLWEDDAEEEDGDTPRRGSGPRPRIPPRRPQRRDF